MFQIFNYFINFFSTPSSFFILIPFYLFNPWHFQNIIPKFKNTPKIFFLESYKRNRSFFVTGVVLTVSTRKLGQYPIQSRQVLILITGIIHGKPVTCSWSDWPILGRWVTPATVPFKKTRFFWPFVKMRWPQIEIKYQMRCYKTINDNS